MYTEAISLGLTIFEYRRKLLTSLKRIRYWLRHGTLRVVIFGPGGGGKSTLGLLLSGKLDIRKHSPKYKESLDIETYKLQGDVACELIVGPGQKRRIISTWPDLYRRLAQGQSRGIINVVSYGYHSFAEIGYKELREYQKGMTKSQLLKKYTANAREEEVRIIRELTPRLKDAKEKIWMITLVTKQDLWWKDRSKVKDFYLKGPYNNCIQEVAYHRGQQNFTHEYLSVSLVMENFISGIGEPLLLTARGYDQNLQNANMETFLSTIHNFSKRNK